MTTVTSTRTAKKSKRFRLAEQQLCTFITPFLYISLASLHDYDVKMPNFTFCGVREHKTTFFFFSWTSIQSVRIQLQKNSQHLTNWMRWNKRDKGWSSANSLFNKCCFRSCRRRRCYQRYGHSITNKGKQLSLAQNICLQCSLRLKADTHEGFCSRSMLQAHFARVSTLVCIGL